MQCYCYAVVVISVDDMHFCSPADESLIFVEGWYEIVLSDEKGFSVS